MRERGDDGTEVPSGSLLPLCTEVLAWRHPRARGAEGRCIGARTDLCVDPRRAKRLAHRIRGVARREGLARVVACSPLRRCRAVAGWLKRFGFAVHVDPRLSEFDFGHWDGRPWDAVRREEIEAWTADFAHAAPGGGDTLCAYLLRVRSLLDAPPAALLITHGGWLSAAVWLQDHPGGELPRAHEWPRAPAHAAGLRWTLPL